MVVPWYWQGDTSTNQNAIFVTQLDERWWRREKGRRNYWAVSSHFLLGCLALSLKAISYFWTCRVARDDYDLLKQGLSIFLLFYGYSLFRRRRQNVIGWVQDYDGFLSVLHKVSSKIFIDFSVCTVSMRQIGRSHRWSVTLNAANV